MSVPKKHHYIPRVHISKFKSENGYFYFLKDKNKLLKKSSNRDIFSVKFMNSQIDENSNTTDHSSIEKELSDKWDGPFNSHLDKILKLIDDSTLTGFINIEPIKESIKFFYEYSIVTRLRCLKQTEEYNSSVFDFEELINLKEEFKNEELDIALPGHTNDDIVKLFGSIENLFQPLTNYVSKSIKELRFPAPTATEVKILVPKKCSIDIFLTKDDSFILPDVCTLAVESDSKLLWHNIEIPNICSIGFPLTKDIFIQIKNNDIVDEDSNGIYILEKEEVMKLNKRLFKSALNCVLFDSEELFSLVKS